MEKIIFENSPSTKTPVSAENLNKIQDNVEKSINNIIIPSVNAIGTAEITLTDGSIIYPFNTLENNTMNAQLNNSGGIICPYDGIINVSASAMLSPKTGYVGIIIKKNGEFITDFYDDNGAKGYGCLETANRLIEVKKNDVIDVTITSSIKTDVVKSGQRTRMTIFYVKINNKE